MIPDCMLVLVAPFADYRLFSYNHVDNVHVYGFYVRVVSGLARSVSGDIFYF